MYASLRTPTRDARLGRRRRGWRSPPFLHALAWLLAVAASAPAQDFRVDRYTVDDGLPGAAVYGLVQDETGKVWLATNGGVVAYDGLEWVVEGTEQGLPRPPFGRLCADAGGRLWVIAGLAQEPLAYREDGRWHAVAAPERLRSGRQTITVLAAARWGSEDVIAVGTLGDGLWLRHGRSWRRIGPEDGLPDPEVRGVAAAGDRFAVATATGLAWVGESGVEPLPPGLLPFAPGGLLTVAVSSSGEPPRPALWVLASTWLGRVDGASFRLVSDRVRLETFRTGNPASLAFGPAGCVWAAYRAQLLRVDPSSGRVERIGRDNGLANEGATEILVDREGNLWLGGTRGVSKLVSMQFATWRVAHGLLEDEVSAIAEPVPGMLVFGHNHGLTILDRGRRRTRTIRLSDPDDGRSGRVLDLAPEGGRWVWVAAADLGLARLDLQQGSLKWFPAVGEAVTSVSALTLEGEGLLVGGTGGLYRMGTGGELRPVAGGTRWVRRQLVDHRGRTWLASRELYLLERGQARQVPGESFAPLGGVYALTEDSVGRIWVGTRRGLYEVVGERVMRPPAPRVDDAVFAVLEDADGRLWFGTDNGVLRWDGVDEPVRFTTRDGLAGREVNRTAMLLDAAGRVWIGTEGGVSEHRSEEERPPSPPPLVEILACEIDGRKVAAGEPVRMPLGAATLEYRFRAVSFLDEGAVRYRVRLEGLDESWSQPLPATTRSSRYTYLPPGRYRFEVRAANADGVWSEPVRSAWVGVPTPPWRHWAVISGAVLALLGGAALAVTSVLRWRYASRLEAEVADRTAELRESEQWSRRLFEEESLARVVVDPDKGLVVDANAAACRLLGLPDPPAGQTVSGLGLEELPGLGAEPAAHDLHRTVDGRDVEVWRQALLRGGRRLELVTLADVTERRRLSEARGKAAHLEAVGRLAGGIAHDFNNLLTTLVGRLAVAGIRVENGGDARAELESASEIVLRARHLTGQLLAFSTGGDPVLRVVDARRAIGEAVELAGSAPGLAVTVEADPDLWPVMADRGQLVQVVANLVLHGARVAAEEGRVAVRASNRPEARASSSEPVPGASVEVEVRCEGTTLSAGELDRLFEPYAGGRDGIAGLGLATAFSIMRKHGGTIVAGALPDGGTSLRVLVPAVPGAAVAPEVRPAERVRGSGRVLAMDDEPDLRTLYRDALELLGYEVEVAQDGEEAVEAYRRAAAAGAPFDAVILDLTIASGIGGLECLVRLREIDPEVRAIVASGYSNDPVMARFREVGFASVLPKPFSVAELARTVRQATGERA